VLCYIDATFTGDNGTLSIASATISDAFGNSLDTDLGGDYQVGVQETYGCLDPNADNYNSEATADCGDCCEYWGCTDSMADNFDDGANVDDGSCTYPPASFNVYRDGALLASNVSGNSYVDSGLGASMTYCYLVEKVDMGEVIASSNESCATTDETVTQSVELDPFTFNMMSLNVVPGDMSTSTVFSGLDLLIVKNDGSDYYVPGAGVDQIGNLSTDDGYKVFLSGASGQTLDVTGAPLSGGTVDLNAFTMNLLPYLLQDCMSTSDVFAGYESDLLVVKNDDSEYYVPSSGVQTLEEMCPGEAYAVFLSGASDVSFTYPMGGVLASTHQMDSYKERAHANSLANTGESHLILITDVSGDMKSGDQLRAYANGSLVGSINIVEEHLNGTHPIDLVATGSVDMSLYGGPVLPGYVKGDMIELTYYTNGMEYKVDSHLTDDQYGNAMELSTGSITLLSDGVNPTEFGITNNYPNPFNPNTTIEYNVENSGHVSLKIYDIMGRSVRTLINEYKESGRPDYKVVWDGRNDNGHQVSAGLYLYTLSSNGMTDHAKMVLMK
jgi:hypothetical protein